MEVGISGNVSHMDVFELDPRDLLRRRCLQPVKRRGLGLKTFDLLHTQQSKPLHICLVM